MSELAAFGLHSTCLTEEVSRPFWWDEGIKRAKCGVEASHGPVFGKNLRPCGGKVVSLQRQTLRCCAYEGIDYKGYRGYRAAG